MKTYLDCIPCFVRQTLAHVRRATTDESVHEKVARRVLRVLADMDLSTSPPAMGQEIFRAVREITGNKDAFAEDKRLMNEHALSLVSDIRARYNRDGAERFESLVRLAIAGNIIDLGARTDFHKDDVLDSLARSIHAPIDMHAVEELREEINRAKRILYLGDNAGEIVFDRLFIEHLPAGKITYVVKGSPVINDVTMEDAAQAGMPDFIEVIDNGSDAPGTILADCSADFRAAFDGADLVIAKGQGNYETLSDVDKNIAFLLQVKCPVIARDAGCETGSFVIVMRKNLRPKEPASEARAGA
ncbi:MAG: DUF89 family protein [Chitinivibrionales bacterium]|nr:DUF89 family protein [Chitinivibrionales bacterium]MBD3396885.1 DUF89 family protein [Chitinivibrionales bacterium]